jgi:hypothetical protein
VLEPGEAAVDGAADGAAVLARGVEDLRAAGGRQRDRLDVRQHHGDRERHAELEEVLADDAAHEHHGQEDGDDGEGGRERGEAYLGGALGRGPDPVLPHLRVPVDVLEHHHGVVDDEADRERQAQQGEGVEREAEEVDDRDRAEERHGDREDDVERARERAEEEPAHEGGEDQREPELDVDVVDRLLDEARLVEEHLDLHAVGQARLDLGDALAHPRSDRDCVRAALLEDAERLERRAVEIGRAVPVLEAVFDRGDVLERDGDAVHTADDDLLERLEIERLAEEAHVDLPPAGVELAAGDLDVLAADRADDVARDDTLLGELAGVEPDADVAVEVSVELDLTDALDRLQLLLHLVAGDVGEQLARERPGDADREDRRVVRVRFRDGRRGHVLRQLALGLRDARLDVLKGEIDVTRDVEAGRDAGGALSRGRRELLDALDLGDRLLERLEDLALHGARRGARPRDAHRDVGVVDVRILADAHPRDGDEAEEDGDRHHHPGEDRILDGDVGDAHGC